MSRVSSSGSPTQWIAIRSPLPASTCRSTQLYAALILPPTNHFANGGLSQSSTVSHLVSQDSRSAAFSQNASRSASASSYAAAVTLAFSASSFGGSKRRSSCDRLPSVSSLTFSPIGRRAPTVGASREDARGSVRGQLERGGAVESFRTAPAPARAGAFVVSGVRPAA